MNINSVIYAASQPIQQLNKNQKTNTDYRTEADKLASESEKLDAFKKEVWNEIDSLTWDSRMNISIQITDKAFERMMTDDEFKNDMLKIIREESIAAHPPGDVSLTWINENGYQGYSYIDSDAGYMAFSANTKDKENFYSRKSKKKEALKEHWENEQLKKRQQELVSHKKFESTVYHRKLSQRDAVAKIYEDNIIENLENSM